MLYSTNYASAHPPFSFSVWSCCNAIWDCVYKRETKLCCPLSRQFTRFGIRANVSTLFLSENTLVHNIPQCGVTPADRSHSSSPNFWPPRIRSSLCHLQLRRHASVIALKVSACSHCHYLSLSLPPSFSRSSTASLSCISFLSSRRQIKVPSLVGL